MSLRAERGNPIGKKAFLSQDCFALLAMTYNPVTLGQTQKMNSLRDVGRGEEKI